MRSQLTEISRREQFSYGCADFGQTSIIQLASIYALYFYTDIIGLGATFVGSLFLISRLWDAVNDPIMGYIVDRTNSRWGRCRPYLIPGSVALAGTLCLIFYQPALSGGWLIVYVVVSYNLFNMAFTATNLPLTAMLPLMTADLHDRVRLSSTRAIFQAFAYAGVPLLCTALLPILGGSDSSQSYTFLALGFGVLCVATFVVCFRNTAERVAVQAVPISRELLGKILLKDVSWFLLLLINLLISVSLIARASSAIYYFKYNIGDLTHFGLFLTMSTLSMIPMGIIAPSISKRIGKEYFVILGCLLGTIGNLMIYFSADSMVWLIVGGVFGGCTTGAFISVLFAMQGDIADATFDRIGIRVQAILTSTVALGYKAGLGVGSAIVGWLLGSAGYEPTQQSATVAVESAISVAFIWVPLCSTLLAIAFLIIYRRVTH